MGAMLFAAPGAGAGGGMGMFSECSICSGVDASEWILCIDEERPSQSSKAVQRKRRAKGAANEVWTEGSVLQRMEELTKELFRLHDLNGNGVLEEVELVSLNEKIAILHHGKDTDTREVRSKYTNLFRTKLDPLGRPVPYEKFRTYAQEVLNGLDTDLEAQEMILEQFVAEALSGRQAINCPSLLGDLEPSITSDFEAVGRRSESRTLELEGAIAHMPLPKKLPGEEEDVQLSGLETPPEVVPPRERTAETARGPFTVEGMLPQSRARIDLETGDGSLQGPSTPPASRGLSPSLDPSLQPAETAADAGAKSEKLVLLLEPRSIRRADSDPTLDQSAGRFCGPLPSGRSSNMSS